MAEWRFKAGEIAICLLLDLSLFLNKYDHRYKRFVSLTMIRLWSDKMMGHPECQLQFEYNRVGE